jgi:hypothetical protein
MDFIHGINTILRYIVRVASVSTFYGQDAIQASHVCFGKLYAIKVLQQRFSDCLLILSCSC